MHSDLGLWHFAQQLLSRALDGDWAKATGMKLDARLERLMCLGVRATPNNSKRAPRADHPVRIRN